MIKMYSELEALLFESQGIKKNINQYIIDKLRKIKFQFP